MNASYQQSQKENDQQLQAAADKIALLENSLTVQKISTSSLSDQHQKGSLGEFNKHTSLLPSSSCKHCMSVHTIVGETVPEDTETNFTYLLFYKTIHVLDTLKVDFVFVVTYNHELFLEVHAHYFT